MTAAFGRWRRARDNYDKKLLEESETIDTVDSRHRRHLASGVDNTAMTTTTSSTSNQQYVSSVDRSAAAAAGLAHAHGPRYRQTVCRQLY